jgi:hypothetical protein
VGNSYFTRLRRAACSFVRETLQYDTLAPKSISIVPPENIIDLWKTDYERMQRTMIYGKSLPFNELIDKIKQLNELVNKTTGYF